MPHVKTEQTKAKPATVIQPRIEGDTAKRIEKLAALTRISENRIANMACKAGIAKVEKKLR